MPTFNDFTAAASGSSRFVARFEFIGSNSNNLSGKSRKFWTVERLRDGGPLRIRYGRITNDGSREGGSVSNEGIHWEDAYKKAGAKASKGYRLCQVTTFSGGSSSRRRAVRGPVDVRGWASAMPAPFNTIVTVDPKTGEALDSAGFLVCKMPVAQAESIVKAQAAGWGVAA